MWQDLEIGKSYIINAKIFDHLAEETDYCILLVDIKSHSAFSQNYTWEAKEYIFLTAKGYESIIFFANDEVWFEQLQI